MNKRVVAFAVISIAVGIALGAFGAHGLRRLTTNEDILRGYQTGIDYHLFHSLAFLLVGVFSSTILKTDFAKKAFGLIVIGIILFAGSLYLLTCFRVMGWSYTWIGPVTPLGGLLLVLGWSWLGYSFLRTETAK
ncbi:MAG: DUF423 domain-containing protein [Bacteroidota bacterium]